MKKLLGLLAALTLTLGFAHAQVQAGQGALAGVVTDATKAAIPGAKVVLTNPGIGLSRETVTNSSGEYTFSPLTVTDGYVVSVTVSGFSSGTIKGIATSVGTVITQNIALNVGSDTQTVEVQAGNVEQVQTDTSAVSQLIDSTIFAQAPLETRSSNNFVGLTAGASSTAGTGRGYAVNGARSGAGNFMLDGFDNNDQGLGGASAIGPVGGAVTTISPDAIQEYRVISSVPNAEYGRAGGFTTDTVLKSGTNRLHGSAFEYNRIQALAQNNWFSKSVTPRLQDHLVRNQFGGSIGGPIFKDKTFFYATAEFHRRSTGSPSSYEGITQDFFNFVKSGAYETFQEGLTQQNPLPNPNGDGTVGTGFCPQYLHRTCPGAFASVKTLGPVFSANYNATPSEFPFGTQNPTNEPTDLLLGGTTYLPVNVYAAGNLTTVDKFAQNRGTIKLDHKLTQRDQLSFTYSADLFNDTSNTGGGSSFPGPAELSYGGAQIFGITYEHTFTPNLINVAKGGYLRHVNNITASGFQGTPTTYTQDSITTGFGKSTGLPQLFTENQFSYEDSATYTKGTHTMKAGFRYARTRNGSSFYNDVNGTLVYWGAADLLTDALDTDTGEMLDPADYPNSVYGTLYEATASLDLTTGVAPDPYRGYRANEFAAYVQDDWKASSRLHLNYGLRWDYFGPPHNFRSGIDSNVYFGSDTTLKATLNPFAPNVPLLLGEQGAKFECVAVDCGVPSQGKGYASSNGSNLIWQQNKKNFAPRIGFAYDTFGNGKLVLRGGFGIGYDRLYNNVFENIRFNGPHFVDNTLGYGVGSAGVPSSLRAALVQANFTGNTALSVAGASPTPRHVDQHLKTAYYENVHFGLETHVKGFVIETNYIGTFGRQLVGIMNANTFEGRTACSGTTYGISNLAACRAAGVTNFSTTRPDTLFGSDNFRTNGFSSNYASGQVSVRRGLGYGFQILANYTYSKALDQISDVFTLRGGGTGIPTPYNPSHNYGPADFDLRHNAVVTVNYVSQSSAHKYLLAGWGVSPIITMRSGATINVNNTFGTYDPNKSGLTGIQRALYIGGGKPTNAYNHSVSPAGLVAGQAFTLNAALFTNNKNVGVAGARPFICPTSINNGLFCDVGGRNSLTGLRQYNVDSSISKHIPLGERFNLTVQASFFDVDGHVEFADPVGDVNSPNFGRSLSTLTTRTGQLAARIDF